LKFGLALADLQRMILLIWQSERAEECARVLEREFEQPVRIASNLQQAHEELKGSTFSAVLLDQWLYEGSPAKADFVFQHVGSAAPVIMNFAISAIDRVARTLRTALEQRRREMQVARRNASNVLTSELKDDLTALFLSCGIALQDPTLTSHAAEQLRRIEEIGKQIQQKLLVDEEKQARTAAHA
jgi:hypothetical protein